MSSLRHLPRHRLTLLERLVLIHIAIFFVAVTWAFGGNALGLRSAIAWWGCLGPILTLAAVLGGWSYADVDLRPLWSLWPFVLFNAVVLLSLTTQGFRQVHLGSEYAFVPRPVPWWRPSSAIPRDAGRALWLFDGIYVSCFNLVLVLNQRRALRGLLLLAGANALVLAIFGTLQKLAQARGVFFGHVPVPRQPLFFSTFLYHNHWGAFAVLMTAVCLGLVWRYALIRRGPGFFQTPALGGLIAVLFLAATAPMSASRSCTMLMGLLLAGAYLHWALRLARRRRSRRESIAEPLIGAGVVAVLAIGAIAYLAGDVIRERMSLTQQQLADMRAQGGIGSRITLYRDTWRMAEDRLWFGWGMGSYPNVFILYNSQSPNPVDHLPIFYNDAHSDWLQAVAEHGLIGSVLLGLCAAVPLAGLRRLGSGSPLAAYLFAGCGLILLYAWIEFPFGNVAVVLTWWICLFSALRYTQLQAREAERLARVEASTA